jgi:hypothetical protein
VSTQVAYLLQRLDVGRDMQQIYGMHVRYGQSSQLTSLDKAMSYMREIAASAIFERLIKSVQDVTDYSGIASIFFTVNNIALKVVEEMLKTEGKYRPIIDQMTDLEHFREEISQAKVKLLNDCYFDSNIMSQGPISFALMHLSKFNLRNDQRKEIMHTVISAAEGLVFIMDSVLWLICNLPYRAEALRNDLESKRTSDSFTDNSIYPTLKRYSDDLVVLFKLRSFTERSNDLLKLRNQWSAWLDDSRVPDWSQYRNTDLANLRKVKGRNPFV